MATDGERADSEPAKGEGERVLLQRLAEQLPAILWTTDRELRFTSSCGGALRELGLAPDQVTGMSLVEYFGTTDRAVAAIDAHQRALHGESVHYETVWQGRWYETYVEPFRDDHGEIVGAIAIARDVTEQRRSQHVRERLESQIRQHHKLEAVGNLAGGVAHEINNPVQSIMNFAHLIRARSKDENVRDYADEIVNETQRVATIVRNLQAFARQGDELPTELPLHQVVERTLSLFRSVMRKEQIEVSVKVPEDLPAVWFRGQGLQQIIVNLLTSARDALNDRYPQANDDKRIFISAERAQVGGRELVRLVIEDHGTGIAESDLAQAFEEFKTLPGRDQGSGLNLSICRSIVRENDGAIFGESVPGSHTRFYVDLPLAAD